MASERDDDPDSRPPSPAGGRGPRPARDDEDELLEREVERAVAPYRRIFPPAVVEDMADLLRAALIVHPVLGGTFQRLRPPPNVYQSDEVDLLPDGRPLVTVGPDGKPVVRATPSNVRKLREVK